MVGDLMRPQKKKKKKKGVHIANRLDEKKSCLAYMYVFPTCFLMEDEMFTYIYIALKSNSHCIIITNDYLRSYHIGETEREN